MNRKTFAVAAIFFLASLAWFVINVVWAVARRGSMADLLIALFFLIAGIGMMYNEYHKKKRRHLADVHKPRIP